MEDHTAYPSKPKSHFGDYVVSNVFPFLSNHLIPFLLLLLYIQGYGFLTFYVMFSFLITEPELCTDFEELHEDDELKTAYPCPFCDEDFDLLDLCCHIDDLHSTQANTGVFMSHRFFFFFFYL